MVSVVPTAHDISKQRPDPQEREHTEPVGHGGHHAGADLRHLDRVRGHARFGQAGPRAGSFDAGFGTGYLARVVGEKRAREIWFLCRRCSAEGAERWGLVNRVVPAGELHAEVRRYADEILALSPTALRFLTQSFNLETEQLAGQAALAFSGLHEFLESDEAREGISAFSERRPPEFARFRGRASRPL
jgi:2-ketocyclohexanecarboxyl-CoA hydrolase